MQEENASLKLIINDSQQKKKIPPPVPTIKPKLTRKMFQVQIDTRSNDNMEEVISGLTEQITIIGISIFFISLTSLFTPRIGVDLNVKRVK